MDRGRLNDLFDRAIDLAPSQRSQWLDTECADDPVLRAELERWLRADTRASDFLERPPGVVAAAIDNFATRTRDAPCFPGWRTVRRIGTGGTGEVWLAERDGDFAQRAAIK